MTERRRSQLNELNPRSYVLYRVICGALEDLQQEILAGSAITSDLSPLASAMQDRRLLVEWLRDLGFPPASTYNDCGITAEVEDVLMLGSA
ncbi:hypothetical protein KQ304_08480 [Synechococcus sp. CS-1329]|uniref:hypothetical protein n=1 Tax=Synechococcus sp. CS-1329 TaxID=2847975 RepID=UPI00223BCBB6|nr:hypothetical protein [Synechococcus sp. CS-1329]MCT0219032.1 hypothetical protein [Synechococcus sp. CS-1329]